MKIELYAIKVGKTNLEKLDVSSEFEFGVQTINRIEYDQGVEESNNPNQVDVYDVLLAGIKG